MAKKDVADKAKKPAEKKEGKVLIEVMPLCGIGGVGRAGERGYVSPSEAKEYVAAGQAKIVKPEKPVAVERSAK